MSERESFGEWAASRIVSLAFLCAFAGVLLAPLILSIIR